MPTPPTPPTRPVSPVKPVAPKAPEQSAKPIMGNYDISNADTDELKRALKQFYRFAELEQDETKKKKYLDNVAEIEAELNKRENTTKISPELMKGVTTGVTNAANSVKEVLNGVQ